MGRGPNTNTRNLGIFFQETVKQKNSKSTAMCFQRQKKVYLKTCSAKRHVFPLRFIYSQAKFRRSLNFKLGRQINLPVNKL